MDPGVGLSGEDDACGDGGSGHGQAVVRRSGASDVRVRVLKVAGGEEVAVDEAAFGDAALGAGVGIEQPVFEVDGQPVQGCRD